MMGALGEKETIIIIIIIILNAKGMRGALIYKTLPEAQRTQGIDSLTCLIFPAK